jgi:hypothetical protein
VAGFSPLEFEPAAPFPPQAARSEVRMSAPPSSASEIAFCFDMN